MHELSIVEALIALCEENAKTHKAKCVKEIQVKIGRLSGVEIELFKNCFETFKQTSEICKEARLVSTLEKLEILCQTCKQKSVLEKNIFKCPLCKSTEIKVLSGEDLHLMRLVME